MKVKVRKSRGVTGNQKNYGLITGSIWNYEDKPTSNNVGTTLSPVDRDEANIEAERGETVVGDLDNDGNVEHAKIGGKRHVEGGTPLNVPDGSFIFSDTRDLKIKNKDLLKDVFNMNYKSGGVTPAKVASRYELNKFQEILNDPWADPMDKKTAQLMIDNNMKKLGQLALVQEGMKGFPDGVPDIAKPLFASDLGQSQPSNSQAPQAKYGGLPKHQKKGEVVTTITPEMRTKMQQVNPELYGQYYPNQYSGSIYESGLGNDLREEGRRSKFEHPFSLPTHENYSPAFDWINPEAVGVYLGTKALTKGAPYLAEGLSHIFPNARTYMEYVKSLGPSLMNKMQDLPKVWKWPLIAGSYIAKDPASLAALGTYGYQKIKQHNKKSEEENKIPSLAPASNTSTSALEKWFKSQYPNMDFNSLTPDVKQKFLDKFYGVPETTQPKPRVATSVPQQAAQPSQVQKEIKQQQAKQATMKNPVAAPRMPASQMSDAQIRQSIGATMGIPPDSVSQDAIDAFKQYERGGSLPVAQQGVFFNVKDPQQLQAAQAKGLSITRPYIHYNPALDVIGEQTTQSGKYDISPEGILYRKGTPMPQIEQYRDYPIDWTQYKGGFDKFKSDIAAAKGHESAASKWFVEKANDYAVGKTGYPIYDVNQKGVYVPGYEWSTAARFEDVPTAPEQSTAEQTKESSIESAYPPKAYYNNAISPAKWWNYDIVNYANALGNYFDVEPGNLPPYQQYSPSAINPTFVDPARAIAQQQGLVRQSQEAIGASADPTTGRANMIAAQAQSAPQIANIMAQYDQQNVGIANQYGQHNAQAMNEAQLQNMKLRQNYADEIETRHQQYVNALREGRTDVANTIMQGMKNASETAWVNAMYPTHNVDPATGNIFFKQGYDPATGNYLSKDNSSQVYVNAYDQLRKSGLTHEEAVYKMKLIYPQLFDKNDAEDMLRKKMLGLQQMGGTFNPMDLIWNS
jgi:hypothetical protein